MVLTQYRRVYLNIFSCNLLLHARYTSYNSHLCDECHSPPSNKARTGRPLQVRPRADNPCKLGAQPKLGFPVFLVSILFLSSKPGFSHSIQVVGGWHPTRCHAEHVER